MEDIGEEAITDKKKKSKWKGRVLFLLSYLTMLILFFWGCSVLLSIFPVTLGLAPIGAVAIMYLRHVVKAIYIIHILMGFILGRLLRKRCSSLAKGFKYGSITIIVLSIFFYIFLITS